MDRDRRSPEAPVKIIYDFGANNGDDIPYYLKKADLVVAIEANPSLAKEIERRFANEIEQGRLRIENCVVVAGGDGPKVDFYLHKRHHVLGRVTQPDQSVIGDYDRLTLPARSVMEIVTRHGAPYYIKTDIEGYDHVLLRELFQNGIRPPYISAEATTIQVFALLVAMGNYKAFKLVDGATVAKKYSNHWICVGEGQERYSFPPQSAGPFGEDVAGDWMNADDLFGVLAKKKMGWRDIHATSLLEPDPTPSEERRRYVRRHLRGWIAANLRARGNGEKNR